MRKYRIACLLVTVFLSFEFVVAQTTHVSFSTGLSVDLNTLQWSIAGNIQGQAPNILSELIFKKITSVGPYLDFNYRPFRFLVINSFYKKDGSIGGSGSDADYSGDNRTNNTYNKTFRSNKGAIEKFNLGLNFCLLDNKNLSLRAGLSYVHKMQKFHILSDDFDNLKSTYEAKWKGPKILLSADYRINRKLSLGCGFNYCFCKYTAKGDWNLIDEFMHPLSFEQHSHGRSIEGAIKVKYTLKSFIILETSGIFGSAKSLTGVDKSYLRNSEQILTQFNGSKNNFCSFNIGTSFIFCNKQTHWN